MLFLLKMIQRHADQDLTIGEFKGVGHSLASLKERLLTCYCGCFYV